VVFAWHVVERKAPAHRLLIQGIRGSRWRVELSGLILAFSSDRVLHTGQLQQVSELCRVEDVASVHCQYLTALLAEKGDGPEEIPFARGRDGPMAEQHSQSASGAVGGKHPLKDSEGYTRLVAEATHQPASGIEMFQSAGTGREGVVTFVEVPDSVPQAAVARRAAQLLDPGMLVRRDRLGGELAADPVRLLGEHDPPAQT
jgi:hypothetical protein